MDFFADDSYDYIPVAVNSNQMVDLLPELNARSGRATIVFLQNMRLGDDGLIGRDLERTRYVITYPIKVGGGRTGNVIDTVIFGLALADTVIGEVDGKITPRVKTLQDIFQNANLNPRLPSDIIPYIRTHYVWAACCVAAYLKAGNYARFCQADIIKESYLAMREGWEICVKQGINPRRVIPTRFYYLPFFLLAPVTKWLYCHK